MRHDNSPGHESNLSIGKQLMLNFYSALSFLTIIRPPRQAEWENSSKVMHFPIVGLLIGILLLIIDHALSLIAYGEIRAALDLIFLAVITGGLHLDGLADSADGLFSHKSKERILEIMKDPHVGAMGVITVALCLLLKFSGITGIKGENAWVWLLTAPALARSSQVIGLVFMDNARGHGGIGAHFYQKHNYKSLLFCFLPLIIPFCINIRAGLFISVAFAISTISSLLYFQSRIGGMTGDTFGAATEIVETAILVSGGLACTSIPSL